ncbi:glutamate racemase [Melghirimyces profundicolus]|uniref:Glutamate racemase n=1 Tax=Melghirimyces profundicolus TaxID=1242148 RepID=A0A2T6BTH5_9BACL|nr:glutamate racemase [Melghirimyces profundicolus]PTX59349.1 glutamate racemase [Melghirimyces profundicolus]
MTDQISSQSAVGILDSGVGGLTVVKEVFRQLPKERVLYFGDTLRCPYGPRTPEEVRRFTLEIVRYLSLYPLKALVIACNTATAAALEEVRRNVSVPVLGVIEPGARAAITLSSHGRVGVIGTEGTIRSSAYERALKQIDPDLYVVSHSCPTLVPLVESGGEDTPQARQIVRLALSPLKKHRLDSLILGCTHYPLISGLIGREMGSGVTLISSAEETARELSAVLHHKGLLYEGPARQPHDHLFFTSGRPEAFRSIAENWLAQRVSVEPVVLPALEESPVG